MRSTPRPFGNDGEEIDGMCGAAEQCMHGMGRQAQTHAVAMSGTGDAPTAHAAFLLRLILFAARARAATPAASGGHNPYNNAMAVQSHKGESAVICTAAKKAAAARKRHSTLPTTNKQCTSANTFQVLTSHPHAIQLKPQKHMQRPAGRLQMQTSSILRQQSTKQPAAPGRWRDASLGYVDV